MQIEIDKNIASWWLLCGGMILFFFADLHPWFMWPVEQFMMPGGAMLCGMAVVLSMTTDKPLFERTDFFYAFVFCSVLYVYSLLTGQVTLGSIVVSFSGVVAFYCLLRLSPANAERLIDVIAMCYGILMLISVGAFLGVLVGFSLPFTDAEYQDGNYHYLNYRFFMISILDMEEEMPRFCSFFIEPSHVGTTANFLLLAQWGKWRRWYNIPIMAAIFCSLSLAAYILFPIIIFLGLWIDGKRILPTVFILLGIIVVFFIGVMTYEGGDNVLYDRIVDRLTIEDGGLKGNNRVDADFNNMLMDMLDSPDIFFGRDGSKLDWGNSGATVFLYDYGIVGMVLVLLMYFFTFLMGTEERRVLSAAFVIFLIFLVDGHATWFCYFIPIFIAANRVSAPSKDQDPIALETAKQDT